MAPTVVLISGANRGIGRTLLQRYLARPNYIVIAANRNLEHISSSNLKDIPTASGSRLIVVKVDANNDEDAPNAVSELKKQGIDHIDLVIANAGVSYKFGKVSEIDLKDVRDHFEPNVYGVVRLYQATLPLLLKSEAPKWVTMGSIAGSIEKQPPIDNAAYGPSKAAAHWFTKRMNGEEEKLTAFVVTPGWVPTDLGNGGARHFGFTEAPDSLEESCENMMKLFDKATKETHGGKLWEHYGEPEPW